MTREIKFRAWVNGEMIDENHDMWGIYWDKNGFQYNTKDAGCGDWVISEVMQYTGLKDKNGNEIYEGDIVKFVGAEFERQSQDDKWVEDEKEWIEKIQFKEGCFYPFDIVAMWHNPNYTTCEIIGNIYENPELITRKR